MIRTAVGGESAGDVYEHGSDRHFSIVVRLAPQYRQSAEAISKLTIGVSGPKGITQIPLSEVARIRLVSGPSYIYREQQQRYLFLAETEASLNDHQPTVSHPTSLRLEGADNAN